MTTKKPKKSPAGGRRRPKQARAQAMVDAILTATAHILREGGPEAANTNRIAERAGASIGSLYQYFPNKTALFTAVAEVHVARLEQEVLKLVTDIEGGASEEIVGFAVRGLFTVVRVDAPLHAALQKVSLWGMTSDVMRDFRTRIEGQLGALLALRASDYSVEIADPMLTARLSTRALAGILDATLAEAPERVHDEALIEETVRIIEGRFGIHR